MSYDKENIFAKILRGEIPCDKIYEDEYILSFNDIKIEDVLSELKNRQGTSGLVEKANRQ